MKKDILKNESESRLKTSKDFCRDIKIFNRYQELLKIPHNERENDYIEIQITKELRQVGIYTSEGNIRSIVNRINNLIKESNSK